MYSNVGGLNLSGKDPGLNPFGRMQVYLIYTHTIVIKDINPQIERCLFY